MSEPGQLSVTQVKSVIGTKPVHRKTMKALGLGGIGRSINVPDSPDVRGMLAKVTHLVSVETASHGGSPPTASDGGSPPTASDGGSPPTASEESQ